MQTYKLLDLVLSLEQAHSNVKHFGALMKYEPKCGQHYFNAVANYKCLLNTLINEVSLIPGEPR